MDLDNLIEKQGQPADTDAFVESMKNDNTNKRAMMALRSLTCI
jgi:hypothetical protein